MNNLIDNIMNILNDIKISEINILTKKFVYKDEIAVFDIVFNKRRFAFDIKPISDTRVNIKLVWRKGFECYSSLIDFNSDIENDCIVDVIGAKIKEVINVIYNHDVCISVVIPMHNSEKFIPILIEKLKKQTLNMFMFEVIFIDDGSKDKTVETVINLSNGLNYYIIRRPIASGNASAPRNEGIKIARGDYIIFVDADDYISEYTLNDALSYAYKNNSDIVYLKLAGVNGRQLAMRPWSKGNVPYASVFENFLLMSFQPTKLFKTNFIRKNNLLFDPSFLTGEDKLFIITSICLADNISILCDKDYGFVVNHDGDHLSKKKDGNELFRLYKLIGYSILYMLNIENNIKIKEIFNVLLYRFCKYYYIKHQNDESIKKISFIFNNIIEYYDDKYIYSDGKKDVEAFIYNNSINECNKKIKI